MTILTDKIVKTRKSHKCFGCAREFEAGTELRYQTSVDSGDFFSLYFCKTCDKYWEEYMDNGDEINYGELKSEGEHYWEEIRKKIEGQ